MDFREPYNGAKKTTNFQTRDKDASSALFSRTSSIFLKKFFSVKKSFFSARNWRFNFFFVWSLDATAICTGKAAPALMRYKVCETQIISSQFYTCTNPKERSGSQKVSAVGTSFLAPFFFECQAFFFAPVKASEIPVP